MNRVKCWICSKSLTQSRDGNNVFVLVTWGGENHKVHKFCGMDWQRKEDDDKTTAFKQRHDSYSE